MFRLKNISANGEKEPRALSRRCEKIAMMSIRQDPPTTYFIEDDAFLVELKVLLFNENNLRFDWKFRPRSKEILRCLSSMPKRFASFFQ